MARRTLLRKVLCRRGCGRTVHTLKKSIYGANALHGKYSGICSNCTTDEERNEILRGVTEAAYRTCVRG
jgi:hypothetical protein